MTESKLNAKNHTLLIENETDMLLNAGDNIQLHSLYSSAQHQENFNHKLVILIHGWEGSAESTYLQLMAHHLYAAGISVYRLNLRDHGDSHHLNEDLFHSCRLDEVVAAIEQLAQRFSTQKIYLLGFSHQFSTPSL